ncbi:mitogen-activated protein kinase-binding protein 1 isoform X9 [Drosophila albomicans]|uniref:Mitogen-activated protein kinase-binding protein 1 isoform X9 n=1 Tax=Drosophila albomicans TaxID=7291 RepID=A0A9C6SMH1_DROAB|nr:mitogen-activated protein kinase-binding protein 1 isoform X9 [Drosophila albomicans]
MRHLIMTPTSLSMSTPTLSSLHHQRMSLQSQSQLQLQLALQSQSQSPSPLTPHSASPSAFFGASSSSSSPKFPANYERSEKIKLKRVLGLTVCSNAALDVSPISGLLAYPAGCTVVLFNAKRQTQAYLVNTSRKAFTSVAFSRCGRFVATGECGINPAIKVWELETPNGNLEQCSGGSVVAEFVDHKYAVTCVAFSPTGKYLVSVGSQHDMIVNVFDWRANLKMASNKISSKVAAVCFAEDGSYFVTVGNRHVKYWYLEGGRKYKDPIPLMGRSAILGDLRDNDFCAVACGKGICSESTYAITRQGHLVEFSSRRLLDKWVLCRTSNANCICVNERFILVGCAESIIRIFNAATLEYVTTLPRTHYLGVDVAQGIQINHIMSVPQQAKFPDCIAMVFDEQRSKVSCVYNDHSLYIWDLRDISRVGKSHSFLYHSTCIWGVETVPYNLEREPSQTLPEDCFVTCSSDDTIRVWGLDSCANNEIYRKNIYSKELLKIIYSDDELQYIKDQGSSLFDKAGNSSYDGRNGVRCIKISPELQHLASGDRCGNIRVYSLQNLKLLTIIEAHESEVLCLEYSNEKIERKLLASASRDRLIHVFDVSQNYLLLQTLDDHSSSITSIKFVGAGLNFQMISCGADKSIMFRSFQGNIFMRGTNTSGKTTLYDMEVDSNAKHILTACQDRNVRVYGTQNAKQTKTFKGSHSDEGSLIKLSLDPSGIYVATSCTDKTLAVYDYYSSECMARMYGHSELVTGLKFTNDCRHLISASGDGCIFIWQVPHDMIVTMQARMSQQRLRSGHAPLQRPLAPISPPDAIVLESPTSELEHQQHAPKFAVPHAEPNRNAYQLSDVGQLPQWAMRKTATDSDSGALSIPTPVVSGGAAPLHAASSMGNLSSSPSQQLGVAPRARGRWAQRSSQLDTEDQRSNSESPLGTVSSVGGHSAHNVQTSDYNSASSKDIMYNQTYLSEDSSIDSGMETRRELKFIGSNNNGTIPIPASVTSANNGNLGVPQQQRLLPDKRKPGMRFDTHSHDHDGDIEDISDGERTSSEHGMFYNNLAPSTPTDFKVTAMNEDELRKSVRRQKFEKSGLQLPPASGNGSTHTASTGTGTGTSDTEDEGSTPSAENAERSLASTLGGSSENLQQGRDSFLHAALPEGPGLLLERGATSRRSISAKHNTENGKGGVAAPPTITKSYTSTKKEELLQVINKVKQQLENVGHRPLRGSHSISDLSLAANLDGSRSAGASRYSKPGNPKMLNPMPIEESSSSIRRACSLSDLHMGNFGKPSKSNGSSQKAATPHRNGNINRSTSKRNSLQGKSGLGASSNSMNVLNQASDSEQEDSNRLRSAANGQNRNNGPIAANRQYGNKSNNTNSNRRKMPNFNGGTNLQDDSSSEETPNNVASNKPVVPPRPRNLGFDHKTKLIVNSPGNVAKQRVAGAEDYDGEDPEAQVHNVINKLYTTTQAAMKLHANLKNSLLLKELENAVIMSHNMLGNITYNRQNERLLSNQGNNHAGSGGIQGGGGDNGGGINHEQDNGDYLMMVNNCADLLSNLRTKNKPDDCENNS